MDGRLKSRPEEESPRESDVQALREWCATQSHLPAIGDSELALFLRSNYYRLGPTKSTIEACYAARRQMPELFANRDPYSRELRTALRTLSAIPLEGKSRGGQSVMLFRLLEEPRPGRAASEACAKLALMHLELWAGRPASGHALLVDARTLPGRIERPALARLLRHAQDGLALRIRACHLLGPGHALDVLLAAIRPLIKRSSVHLLHLHESVDSLDEFVAIEALPNEMGGRAGSLADLHRAQVKNIEAHRDWFLDQEARARLGRQTAPVTPFGPTKGSK